MGSDVSQRPPNDMVNFSLLNSVTASTLAPRLGKLAIAGRNAILTPHYIPLTSRGAVPHVAHDVMREQTAISGLYFALEDFIEKLQKKACPPVYKTPAAPNESPLRNFVCLPEDPVLVLGPRRVPPLACPPSNTPNSIAVLTAVGFGQLGTGQYVEAVQKLRPDIVVGLADLVLTHRPGLKRQGKMVDRTHAFTTYSTEQLYGDAVSEENRSKTAYFAPILPLDNAQQTLYLDDLEDELRRYISGLALYESESLSVVPESLGHLPRLLFSEPATPHDILREVSLGADLLTIPFLGHATDAGMALDFVFPPPSDAHDTSATQSKPLAIDLWAPTFTTDTAPLNEACQCYTCRNHHRAYIHHLLSAKEMLAWALLQLHNLHTMDSFFAKIRESIQQGTFESDVQRFQRIYASQLPEKTGQGPRVRGYQAPSRGPNEPRRNPRAYGRLDAIGTLAESQSSIATPDTGAEGLEEHGFAKKLSS
ncbi:tRNA-guanine(15) transglycosylase-like protein [Aspergillus pseudonomiae]|uniref:Queuine tRNA-ribosyltransferase accessory subunit 2 n=1 Tax=Aspergillus pseudonomiae TaxID=1506151 RepID=A0A5N7D526_9EURO|nr:tRNA-guanine(15) transglycosylase-like protein [Aspergillus pseudonomiae]KAE8401399.1 tRNA-guanine(15) transglycosylase-like protein [Aspergillus pseudonomiae]